MLFYQLRQTLRIRVPQCDQNFYDGDFVLCVLILNKIIVYVLLLSSCLVNSERYMIEQYFWHTMFYVVLT